MVDFSKDDVQSKLNVTIANSTNNITNEPIIIITLTNTIASLTTIIEKELNLENITNKSNIQLKLAVPVFTNN